MKQGFGRKNGLAGGLGQVRFAAMFAALVATASLTGCSGFFTAITSSGTTPGSATNVYVTGTGSTLTEFSLTSGALAQLSGSPVTLTVPPTAVAISPNNLNAYVGTSTGIFLYTIASGALTEGNNDNVLYLPAHTVQSLVVDATSSWLIISYTDSNEIDALPVSASTGLTTASAPYTIDTPANTVPIQIAMSPANTNIFAALGTAGAYAIGFNPAATSKTPFGSAIAIGLHGANASDTAVAVDTTSTYLFITEASTLATSPPAGIVRMKGIAALTTVADLSDPATGVGPTAVLADLSGAYVYVANGTDGTISGFNLSTTNQSLTAMTPTATFPTAASPIALVEDATKSYILALGNGASPNLWLYSFDATNLGALDVGSTTGAGVSTTSIANGIAVTP
jgi:6-phosphogluconolactonase (cycloisomerase 2 family)